MRRSCLSIMPGQLLFIIETQHFNKSLVVLLSRLLVKIQALKLYIHPNYDFYEAVQKRIQAIFTF